MADDEFYDAVESGLDKMEEEQELRDRLKSGQVIPITPPPSVSPAEIHRLWPEVCYLFIYKYLDQVNQQLVITTYNLALQTTLLF